MSFGLGHGKTLDDAPGVVGVSRAELPPLPDDILTNPGAGRLDPRRWFHRPDRPFEVEIGSGKGTFLLEQGSRDPDTNYLGIEHAGEFYAYAADRVRRRGLANVRMLRADAVEFIRWRVPAAIVRVVHLYFSDPWPKTKHHKNRVVQDRFLAECWRVLEPGGELRVVTDHDELWAWDQEHFARWTGEAESGLGIAEDLRRSLGLPPRPYVRGPFVRPAWTDEGETVGTNYERKMCRDREPHACVLRKSLA
jgi:tRNA (guanine-N7-)-methyltransferase